MDMMDDVAAMAGHGMSTDPLATLESALQPVERYAVHFLEEVRCCCAVPAWYSRAMMPRACRVVSIVASRHLDGRSSAADQASRVPCCPREGS